MISSTCCCQVVTGFDCHLVDNVDQDRQLHKMTKEQTGDFNDLEFSSLMMVAQMCIVGKC